ncbi:hypothetical protein CoNPh35_CDS0074 [Staphylococcus phage S-CoN_Ph35]|nr:hypothetical protein CoNPh35_CDS0074 [Staphylococcus phage S-CoN_Ph35]
MITLYNKCEFFAIVLVNFFEKKLFINNPLHNRFIIHSKI